MIDLPALHDVAHSFQGCFQRMEAEKIPAKTSFHIRKRNQQGRSFLVTKMHVRLY